MTVGRRIWLLAALAAGLTGCRAASTGSLVPRQRPGLAAHKAFDLDGFVAEHNRNAEKVQTLEARRLSIGVAMGRHYNVDGRMALERPRNFKLELSMFGNTKGDIGSNDEEFWYWVINKEQPYIYWCKYADVEASSLAVTYQPEWIIDALGLRTIPPEEAAMIRVREGIEPGTSILTFPVVRDRGEPYSREMIVGNTDRRIKRLIIFGEKPRAPIAEATPGSYAAFASSAGGATTTTSGPDGAASVASTAYLPQTLKLEWKREQLVLEVVVRDVRLNQFDHARSADLFVEPVMPGYSRRNLADVSHGSRPDRRTTTRETIPPPNVDDGIRLGRPTPAGDDEPPAPRVGMRSRRPAPSSEESTPVPTFDDFVGAPTPRAPSSGVQQARMFAGAPSATMSRDQ
jgi:hypothetical protein